jgi:hypothetical protein
MPSTRIERAVTFRNDTIEKAAQETMDAEVVDLPGRPQHEPEAAR